MISSCSGENSVWEAMTWTTPTTLPSCLTGAIIAARVGGGPSSGSFRKVPSRSTS
jgi:hypothetical protein